MNFVKVMKEANRMFDFYQDNKKDCPFTKELNSTFRADWMNFAFEEPEKFADMVKEWSDRYPRPVYPSFRDLIEDMCNAGGVKDWPTKLPANELLDMEIPRQAAKEYGIPAINECGLNKYVEEDIESEWR